MINFLRRFINFFFPIICVQCKKSLPWDDTARVCGECKKEIKMIEGNYCVKCGLDLPDGGEHCYHCRKNPKYYFEYVRASCVYKNAAKTLVHRLKYSGKEYLAGPISEIMKKAVLENNFKDKVDAIVYVPMHRIKEYFRGFNQAELLAKNISGFTGKPVLRAIDRTKMTRSQYKLKKEERQKNVSGCFSVNGKLENDIKGKNLLLVDDVCTTCSTVSECSKVLRQAGADKVYVMVFARD